MKKRIMKRRKKREKNNEEKRQWLLMPLNCVTCKVNSSLKSEAKNGAAYETFFGISFSPVHTQSPMFD
jgi:transcription elongation factor Elf1